LIERCYLTSHETIKEHLDCCKVLLHRMRRSLVRETFEVGAHKRRANVLGPYVFFLTPFEKSAHGSRRGKPCDIVPDVDREKLEEAFDGLRHLARNDVRKRESGGFGLSDSQGGHNQPDLYQKNSRT
jgi:hypothetical protein